MKITRKMKEYMHSLFVSGGKVDAQMTKACMDAGLLHAPNGKAQPTEHGKRIIEEGKQAVANQRASAMQNSLQARQAANLKDN